MQTLQASHQPAHAALAARRDEIVETLLPRARAGLRDEAVAVKADWYDRAAFDTAMQEVQALEQEVRHLNRQLAEPQARPSTAAPAQVAIGTRVTLRDLATGATATYGVIAAVPRLLRQRVITAHSPLGQRLLGHGPGEVVEAAVPDGLARYRIDALGWVDGHAGGP